MGASKKLKYEKPAFKSEKILESAALACGKCRPGGPSGSGTVNCKSLKKLS